MRVASGTLAIRGKAPINGSRCRIACKLLRRDGVGLCWEFHGLRARLRHSCNRSTGIADRQRLIAGTTTRSSVEPIGASDSGPAFSYTTGEAMKVANGFALAALALMLGGCMQSTLEPASETNLKPRDRELLAKAPYEQAQIPEPYR